MKTNTEEQTSVNNNKSNKNLTVRREIKIMANRMNKVRALTGGMAAIMIMSNVATVTAYAAEPETDLLISFAYKS